MIDLISNKFEGRMNTEMMRGSQGNEASPLEDKDGHMTFPNGRASDVDDMPNSQRQSEVVEVKLKRTPSKMAKKSSKPRPPLNNAGARSLIFNKEYTERMTALDQRGDLNDGQLVSYFSIIGMEDSDIIYTINAVKEMIVMGV